MKTDQEPAKTSARKNKNKDRARRRREERAAAKKKAAPAAAKDPVEEGEEPINDDAQKIIYIPKVHDDNNISFPAPDSDVLHSSPTDAAAKEVIVDPSKINGHSSSTTFDVLVSTSPTNAAEVLLPPSDCQSPQKVADTQHSDTRAAIDEYQSAPPAATSASSPTTPLAPRTLSREEQMTPGTKFALQHLSKKMGTGSKSECAAIYSEVKQSYRRCQEAAQLPPKVPSSREPVDLNAFGYYSQVDGSTGMERQKSGGM